MIIHVSDIIVNAYGKETNSDLELSDIHPDVLTIMKSQLETLSEWYPDVLLEIESACNFFLEGSIK